MRTFANAGWDLESRCASLRCSRHVCCASGLVVHLPGTASANDLARPECELWQTLDGIWNPDVLLYNVLGMCFVRAGSWPTSGTASASDLARLECELWQTQNGIWNPDVLLYDALGMRFVRAGSWPTSPIRPVRVI